MSNVHNMYPCVSLCVIFKRGVTLSSFFKFKDQMPYILSSGVVYHVKCEACDASYVGKTMQCMLHRLKPEIEGKENSGANKHRIAKGEPHKFKIDKAKIIYKASNNQEVCIKESLCIKYLKPSLNDDSSSVKLNLFV